MAKSGALRAFPTRTAANVREDRGASRYARRRGTRRGKPYAFLKLRYRNPATPAARLRRGSRCRSQLHCARTGPGCRRCSRVPQAPLCVLLAYAARGTGRVSPPHSIPLPGRALANAASVTARRDARVYPSSATALVARRSRIAGRSRLAARNPQPQTKTGPALLPARCSATVAVIASPGCTARTLYTRRNGVQIPINASDSPDPGQSRRPPFRGNSRIFHSLFLNLPGTDDVACTVHEVRSIMSKEGWKQAIRPMVTSGAVGVIVYVINHSDHFRIPPWAAALLAGLATAAGAVIHPTRIATRTEPDRLDTP